MGDLANFAIQADPIGVARLEVNGEDVTTDVTGVDVKLRPGHPTILTVHLIGAAGSISGPGIVQVGTGAGSGVPNTTVQDFLAGIDSARLDDEVLRRSRFGDSTMDVVLEVLTEWANGK